MNSNNKKIALIGVALVALVVLLYLFYKNSSNTSSSNEPKFTTAEWNTEHTLSNKGPYGLYFMEQLLLAKEKFPTFTVYPSTKALDSIVELDSALFMYVGTHLALTSSEVGQLMASIAKGNNCFISTDQIPDYFFDQLVDSLMITYYLEDRASVINAGQSFELINLYHGDTLPGAWNVLHPKRLFGKKTTWKPLSRLHDAVNYYEITYGAGKVYLYLSPQAFYNYQLKRKEGFDHFMHVFEGIASAHIHWLQFATFEDNEFEYIDEEGRPEDSLLTKIFEIPPLKWAFILLVIGMLLYFILNSRRVRPIVPVKAKKVNQGYNYVATIGDIYYTNNKPSQLLHVLRKNFYTIVHKHFYMDLSKGYTPRQLIILAEKSGLKPERVEKVLKAVDKKYCSSDEELALVYNTVRNFYQDAGCWQEQVQEKNRKKRITIYRANSQALGLIIAGVTVLVLSFVLLAFAVSWAVLLWPLGLGVIFFGSRLLARPLLSFNEEELTFYPLFKEEFTFSKSDLIHIVRDGEALIFTFINGGKGSIDLRTVHPKQHGLVLELKYQFNNKKDGDTK